MYMRKTLQDCPAGPFLRYLRQVLGRGLGKKMKRYRRMWFSMNGYIAKPIHVKEIMEALKVGPDPQREQCMD